MSTCAPWEHRLEWLSEENGITTYYCLDCAELITQFQDTQGA
jgi:hypothetical protein